MSIETNRVAERMLAQHFYREQQKKQRRFRLDYVTRTCCIRFLDQRAFLQLPRRKRRRMNSMAPATTDTDALKSADDREHLINENTTKEKPMKMGRKEDSGSSDRQEPAKEQMEPVTEITPSQTGSGYCVYLLQSTSQPNRTYCGITNRRQRRIRQHNGSLVGGAKQTRGGRPWQMYAVLEGFASKSDALKFEWSCHHPRVRQLRKPHHGREGRINCVQQLLARDPWRNKPLRFYVSDECLARVPTLTDYLVLANNLYRTNNK